MNDTTQQTYRVLARKYRPETFSELIGQEALVRTLSNALTLGRLAHAFVLTGVRRIGKTSTARLLAKGLNCIGADGNGGAGRDGQPHQIHKLGPDRGGHLIPRH